MKLSTITELRCPYTGSEMTVSHAVETEADELKYGLVRSESFEFPVVDGVLLLSLAKNYGGPEDVLTPHAALQIAAIEHLRAGDVDGLKEWIARHAPIVAKLINGHYSTYLDFATDLDRILAPAIDRELTAAADFEVLGDIGTRRSLGDRMRRPSNARSVRAAHQLVHRARTAGRQLTRRRDPAGHRDEQLHSYYLQRFFSVRASATALALRHLPIGGRVLSVCCGHGVFENLLGSIGPQPDNLICMDGQLTNLLVVRELIGTDADFICHDVQFDWPFVDGYFDGVFSSTCLPEIPAQKFFIEEAVRVTDRTGWTLFDSIWAMDSGALRIDPYRYYRYSQNFLEHIRDYVPMFRRIVTDRSLGFDVSGAPADYLLSPQWNFESGDVDEAVSSPRDVEINVLAVDQDRFRGFDHVDRLRLSPELLSFSPAFHVEETAASVTLVRRRQYASPDVNFASRDCGTLSRIRVIARENLADPETLEELFLSGLAVLLPLNFEDNQRNLRSYASVDGM